MKKEILFNFVILMIFLVLLAFSFVSFSVNAQSDDSNEIRAGITPDNAILWGLERFAEQVQLFFTFDKVKKAELRMQFAEERLAEIEVMIKKGELGAERLAEMLKIHGVQKVVNLTQEFQDNKTRIKFREMMQRHVALLQNVVKLLPEETSAELQDFVNKSFNFTIPPEEKDENQPEEENHTERTKEPKYECLKDEDCADNEICVNNYCRELNCGIRFCGYTKEHKCHFYECCKDTDCAEGEFCEEHRCYVENTTTYNLTFKKLEETFSIGPTILSYDFPKDVPSLTILDDDSGPWLSGINMTLAFAIIRNKTEFDYINNNIISFPTPDTKLFSDFENYFLILIFGHNPYEDYFFITQNIRASGNNINVLFRRGSSGRFGHHDGESLLRIKKSDLGRTKNLDFTFIDTYYGSNWTISRVDLN